MTVLPQKASLDVVPSAGWNTILDKIQNGTDLDVLLGQLAGNLRIVVPTSGTGTAGDPFPLADIQTAITSLPATGGKVIVPPGVYQGTTGLTITVPVVLEGASRYGCTIDYNGATGDAITVSGAGHGTVIRNFIITMTGSGTGRAIYMNAVNDFELKNIRVNGNGPAAWAIEMTENFTFEVSHIYIATPGNGFLVTESNTFNYGNGTLSNIFVSLGDSTDAGVVGIEFRNSVNLIACLYLSAQTGQPRPNAMTGIKFDAADDITVILANIEGVDRGIDSINGSSRITWIGPYVGAVDDNWLGLMDVVVLPRIEGTTQPRGTSLWRHADLIGQGQFVSLSSVRYKEEFYDTFWGNAIDARWRQVDGTWALVDSTNGLIRGTTGATIGDRARLDFGNNAFITLSSGVQFETFLQREDTGSYDVYCGMSDGGRDAANEGAWFETLTADATWFAVSSDGATKSREDTLVNKGTSRRHFMLKLGETSGVIRYYVDNALVISKTTNLPASGTGLAPYFEIQTQSSAAKRMNMDYVRVVAGRIIG